MDCTRVRSSIHFRADLVGAERASFADHVERCGACADLLREVEGLDDLLIGWEVPPARRPLTALILSALRSGRGKSESGLSESGLNSSPHQTSPNPAPAATEAEAWEADDFEPWGDWRAPDPSPDFAGRVIASIRADLNGRSESDLNELPAAPAELSPLRRILFGDMRIPRLAAALLFTASILGILAALKTQPGTVTNPSVAGAPPAVSPQINPPTTASLYMNSAGSFETAGRADLVGGGRSLRRALAESSQP